MSGYHKPEPLRDPAHLRRAELLAEGLQRQINPCVRDEQVLDLSARLRQHRLEPPGIRLVKCRHSAQRDESKENSNRIEVTRILRTSKPLDQVSGQEKENRERNQPEIDSAGIQFDPFKQAQSKERHEAEEGGHHRKNQREHRGSSE